VNEADVVEGTDREARAGGSQDGAKSQTPGLIRRLDHVAIAVNDTTAALRYFGGELALRVAHSEEVAELSVRLTYLDAGNAYVQLVEPTSEDSPIAAFLAEHGEGVHHVCFSVDDVERAVESLRRPGCAAMPFGRGRGRVSAFVANGDPHGVRVELTEFSLIEDVKLAMGWLARDGDGA
jgi:methylmalonyl-CoA/ethylmalonyl-CoA epimerase